MHARKVRRGVQELQEHAARAEVDQGQLEYTGGSQEYGYRQIEIDFGFFVVPQGPSVKPPSTKEASRLKRDAHCRRMRWVVVPHIASVSSRGEGIHIFHHGIRSVKVSGIGTR